MEAAFGWTLLSPEAIRKAEARLREDAQGVRDEIGFLFLHQAYADRFFPGTSVQQTRLRYALFVPWIEILLAGLLITESSRTPKWMRRWQQFLGDSRRRWSHDEDLKMRRTSLDSGDLRSSGTSEAKPARDREGAKNSADRPIRVGSPFTNSRI